VDDWWSGWEEETWAGNRRGDGTAGRGLTDDKKEGWKVTTSADHRTHPTRNNRRLEDMAHRIHCKLKQEEAVNAWVDREASHSAHRTLPSPSSTVAEEVFGTMGMTLRSTACSTNWMSSPSQRHMYRLPHTLTCTVTQCCGGPGRQEEEPRLVE
jgi:hypothetical protein